jgi:hypothetical protein
LLVPILFLGCFTALWVLARMKVFAQRNGVFFGLAVTVLFGASVALLEQAWFHLSKRSIGTLGAAPNGMPALPTSAPQAPGNPLLTQSLKYEEPDSSLPRVRASRDFDISIGGNVYAIHRGDTFQLRDERNGEFVIVAGQFLARVPLDSMDQLAPEPDRAGNAKPGDDGKGALEKSEANKIELKARAEAARRFPGLREKGSSENATYLKAYTDLKKMKSELLEDPEWPLRLAEILAQRYHWPESGVVDADTPETTEPSIAPGTKMLSEPREVADPKPAPAPPAPAHAEDALPKRDPDIPPPPRGPQ